MKMKIGSVVFVLIASYSKLNCALLQEESNNIDIDDRIWELSVATPWDMIKSYNYPVENHEVTTEDGYILSLQRIPHGRDGQKSKKSPVLILSGLFTSSALWVYDEEALVYKLADLGYDVWILNNRGIFYSREHKYFLKDSSEYWNFSYHEMGIYDVPNTIDYILAKTGHKTLYGIGHSQGSTALVIMLSKLPEYNSKLKLAVHMAPAIYLSNIFRPYRILATSQFYTNAEIFIAKYGHFGMFDTGQFQIFLANELCRRPTFSKICASIIMYTSGPNFENLNFTKIPIYLSQFPSGASAKQIAQYGHVIRTGIFEEYVNYQENPQSSYRPKPYNLSAITAPSAVIYGNNDWTIPPQNVERFIKQLPNLVMSHIVEDRFFNHVDFMIGNNRFELLDKIVIALLEKF